MYSKRYYRKRKYYRDSEPNVVDMLMEMALSLVVLIARLFWGIFSTAFRKGMGSKVFSNESESVNIHTGESDEKVARERNEGEAPAFQREEKQRYDLKSSPLTPTEEDFYVVLKEIVGNRYQIMLQVQLSSIMKVRDSNYGYTNYHDFNMIKAKSIDFVLYDENLKPYLAIELDDYSHSRPDRINRDDFVDKIMEEAGLRILHVPVARRYDLDELRSEIL